MQDEKIGRASAPQAVVETETKIEDSAKQAKQGAAEVAAGVGETIKEKAQEAASSAKEAVDSITPDDVQAKLDNAAAKARETARNAGEAVKGGLADHGIDTDKLGASLKEDAKNTAAAAIGAGKFVGEKFSGFVSAMKQRAAEANGSEGEVDTAPAQSEADPTSSEDEG